MEDKPKAECALSWNPSFHTIKLAQNKSKAQS